MATKKTPAKQIVKKPVKKSAPSGAKLKPAPAKKIVPAKKVVIAKKAVPKPAAKKVVAKPTAKVVTKKVVKAVVKTTTKPSVKTATKPLVKPATKSLVKPAKKAVKPIKKVVVKSINKSNAKAPAKNVAQQKQVKQLPKKIETKKIDTKAHAVKKAVAKVEAVKVPSKAVEVAKPSPKVLPKGAPSKPVVQKPVVLPKINTKTSRKYEPDFTKSVLDKAPADPGAPIVMYSDVDLSEFKELIQRKLGSAKKELAYLQGLITRKDDMGGDEGDGRYMTMEDGSLSMEREQLSQMASRQITFVDHLEKALMRIENKTYGVCRITGKLIDKARLRAVPHATLSIEAKMGGGK